MEIPVYDIAGKKVTIFPVTPMKDGTDELGDGSDATQWFVTVHGVNEDGEREMPTPEEVIAAFTVPVVVTAVTPTRYKVEKRK